MTPLYENYRKNLYLDVVSGVLGIIIWSSFDRVEVLMIHIIPWYCPWNVRNYLPGLHHNVVASSIDAVFIVVGDQATAIEHFIQMENSSLFQGSMQSWSIQLPKCWLLKVKSAKSRLSWSRLRFIVKFIGELKLIGDYPCPHTKRRQHGYPAKSLATNHRDFPYFK